MLRVLSWCREVLVGTEGGALYCLAMDGRDKRERLWAPLLELDAPNPAICGAYQQVHCGSLGSVALAAWQRQQLHMRSLPEHQVLQ